MVELLERAFGQNLQDFVNAAQAVAPDLSAAAIPCGGGVAAFFGEDSPLTTIKGAGPSLADGDIDSAEAFFRSHGARRVVFELAPWITADVLDLLTRRGYAADGTEDVVVHEPPFQDEPPLRLVVPVSTTDWPELMLRVDEPSELPSWSALADISAVLPGVLNFAVLDENGAAVSCAQLVPTQEIAMLSNDATLESARGHGAQTAAIRQRLRYASTLHVKLAVAEVAGGSTSERNYLRCGFSVAYTRTHYARSLD